MGGITEYLNKKRGTGVVVDPFFIDNPILYLLS
jgi:hypothetical protein